MSHDLALSKSLSKPREMGSTSCRLGDSSSQVWERLPGSACLWRQMCGSGDQVLKAWSNAARQAGHSTPTACTLELCGASSAHAPAIHCVEMLWVQRSCRMVMSFMCRYE